MAKKGNRILVRLESTESGHAYHTTKNRTITERMVIKKYDPFVKKHVDYKEKK